MIIAWENKSREWAINLRNVNMFIARISVLLRMPGLKEKSLVVITRLFDNGGLVKIYTMAKLIRVLHYLWVAVANMDCSSVFFNPCVHLNS